MKNVLDANDSLSLINGNDDSLHELLTLTSGGQCPRSFQISKKDAKLSNLISAILEGDKDSAIPMTQVSPQVLANVIAYLKHHKGVEPEPILQPIRSINVAELVITEEKCNILIAEYARQYKYGQLLPAEVIDVITQFCWDSEYLTIQSGGKDPSVYVVKKLHWASSTFIQTLDASSSVILALDKVPSDTLEHVVVYMTHHKGVEPDPLPRPVRSIHMAQIVSDKWDAVWIDAFDKKTIFEIILAANYLGIKSLTELACAKIATLEKYYREHGGSKW